MIRCYSDHVKSVAFYHIRPKALGVYVPVFNFRYPLSKSYDFFKLTSFTFYEEKVFNRLKTCNGQKYRHSSWHISSPACWSIGPRTVVIIFSQDTVPLNRQGWVINLSTYKAGTVVVVISVLLSSQNGCSDYVMSFCVLHVFARWLCMVWSS